MNDILKMNDRPTPDTDAFSVKFKSVCGSKAWVPTDICRRFERERDEAREALRQIWQSGDAAFLPYIDQETINRWRKAAGWEELK